MTSINMNKPAKRTLLSNNEKGNWVRVSISLPEALHEKLRTLAQLHHVSMSCICRVAILHYLVMHDSKEWKRASLRSRNEFMNLNKKLLMVSATVINQWESTDQ